MVHILGAFRGCREVLRPWILLFKLKLVGVSIYVDAAVGVFMNPPGPSDPGLPLDHCIGAAQMFEQNCDDDSAGSTAENRGVISGKHLVGGTLRPFHAAGVRCEREVLVA